MSKSLNRMGKVSGTYTFWLALVMFAMAAILLSQGCQTGKAWQDLDPQRKAIVLMQTYNEQFDAYQRDAAKPDLTDADKEELAARLTMIQTMHYAVTTYVSYVRLGTTPSMELEIEILQIAQDLAKYLTVKGGSDGR